MTDDPFAPKVLPPLLAAVEDSPFTDALEATVHEDEDAPEQDTEQDPNEAMTAWYRAAEGLITAYWHDPRTAIKYAVAVLQALQRLTPEEVLAINPTDIPPITEHEVSWR